MAIALVPGQVATHEVTATSCTVTLPNNPTAGNLVAVAFSFDSNTATISSLRDSAGTPNNYTLTPSTPYRNTPTFGGGNNTTGIAYLPNVPAGATKTITLTLNTSVQIDLWAIEVSGAATVSPLEADATNHSSTAGTTINLPSYTTVNAGDLLVAVCFLSGGVTAANSPWTEISTIPASGSGAEYMVKAATGAQAVGWTATSSTWGAIMAAFKAASGATPTGTLSVTETADTASLSGKAGTSGALSSTEGTDTASLAGKAGTSGALATTEATDTASISGSFSINGTLSTTEATDTASISGSFKIVGTLSVTESPDIASFTSPGAVSGALSVTETTDTASLSGNAGVAGTLSATGAADIAAISSGNLGTLVATETADTASLSGGFKISGTLSVTGSPDIAVITSIAPAIGVLASIESPDIAAFAAQINYGPSPKYWLGATKNKERWTPKAMNR